MSKARLVITTVSLYIVLGVTLFLVGPSAVLKAPFSDTDLFQPPPVLPSFKGLLIGLIPGVLVGALGYLLIRSDKSRGDIRATWVALSANAIGAMGVCLRVVQADTAIVALALAFAVLGVFISSISLLWRLRRLNS